MDLESAALALAQASTAYADMRTRLNNLHEALTKPTISAVTGVPSMVSALQDTRKSVPQAEKRINTALTRFTKQLDAVMPVSPTPNGFCSAKNAPELLNRAIALHLLRFGHFEVVRALMQDGAVEPDSVAIKEFEDLSRILSMLDEGNLSPAREWAVAHNAGPDFEFLLHKAVFLQLLHSGNSLQALEYARQYLSGFGSVYLSRISELMLSLVASSPQQLQQVLQDGMSQLRQRFEAECCAFLGLTLESPLVVAAQAAVAALPMFDKMRAITRMKGPEWWSSTGELPVEVELPESLQYHPVFVCPVSKEETSPQNPPVLLPCGHLMAKDSVNCMLSSTMGKRELKCPYCPMTTTWEALEEVEF